MMEARIKLRALHAAQREIYDNRARFTVLACGRRFGKTALLIRIASEALLRGEKVAYFTPTYRMGGEVWREIKAALAPVVRAIDNSERRLELHTGGILECWSTSTNTKESVRGRFYDLVVLDEAAYIADATLWGRTIRPLLTDREGRAVFASTPNGRNWFWSLYNLGLDPIEIQWASFRFPSVANPLLNPAEIEDIRRSTPERDFRQEYDAEFTSDAGAVFRGVSEACRLKALSGPDDLPEGAAAEFVMGVDWGRDSDFTVAAVVNRATGEMVDMVRFNQIGYIVQRDRLMRLYEKWQPVYTLAESNSIGEPNIEQLRHDGLSGLYGFQTTAQSKKPLIENLALAIERGEFAMLRDDILEAELLSYTFERLPGGGFRYSAPAGMHDDTVIATALAWHAANHIPRPEIVDNFLFV